MISSLLSKLKTEYKNFPSFYVVVLGIGILTAEYFCPVNPGILGVLLAMIAPLLLQKRFLWMRHIGGVLLFFLLGLSAMSWRINSLKEVDTLERPIHDIIISGQITNNTATFDRQIITLDDVRFLNQIGNRVPRRIKLTFRKTEPVLSIGSRLTARGNLRPPMTPIYPNAYHERRMLSFEGIGAIGQIQEILTAEIAPNTIITEEIRNKITKRIKTQIPEETARLAIPLLIGNQRAVSPDLYNLFRSAGITHVLSVSGFHLSLLAIITFLFIRRFLALFPCISERYSTKKIAGLITLIVASGYILISGMQVPALRSWIMMVLVLLALWCDRNALSVRSWTIAGTLLLLYRPELIFHIGFQLSFMAVLVLITLYVPIRRFLFPNKPASFAGYCFRFVIGICIIDILMTLMLTPLIIYHFNQYALYSAIGNIMATLILSFWVMPLLFLSLILIPFGLETIPLKGASIGLEGLIIVCEKIASFPKALTNMPTFSTTALCWMTGGALLICLMRTRLRLIGIPVILIGLLYAGFESKPDMLIGDFGRTIAVRQSDGHLHFLTRDPNNYTANTWLRHNGEQRKLPPIKNRLPCQFSLKGYTISFCTDTCPRADICFTDYTQSSDNKKHPLTVPGVRVIYITDQGIKVKRLK